MNCLSCGRFIKSEIEAVCTEECRARAVELYENVINHAPVCSKNRSQLDPRKLREDIAAQFQTLVEKMKNAPVMEAKR